MTVTGNMLAIESATYVVDELRRANKDGSHGGAKALAKAHRDGVCLGHQFRRPHSERDCSIPQTCS